MTRLHREVMGLAMQRIGIAPTCVALAERAGLSPGTVADVLDMRTKPKPETVRALGDALRIGEQAMDLLVRAAWEGCQRCG